MRNFVRAILATAAVALLPAAAAGQTHLALDLDLVAPQNESLDQTLYGGSLRAGFGLPVPYVHIAPEIVASYANLGEGESLLGILFDVQTFRAMGGARISFPGWLLRPGVYGHVGYGWIITGVEAKGTSVEDASLGLKDESGLAWDAGLFLDFALIPFLSFGVHGGYNAVQGEADTMDWINAGAHLTLGF